MERATVERVGIETIDVRARGKYIPNARLVSSIEIETILVGDTVLIEEVDSQFYVMAVVASKGAALTSSTATWVPRAPVNLISVQVGNKFTLSWDWGDTTRMLRYLYRYVVDIKLAGGDWGLGQYPISITSESVEFDLEPYGVTGFSWRVRAVSIDAVSSNWSVADAGYVVDDEPPDAPQFEVTDNVGYILMEWTYPTQADTPDLAGFRIYSADDGSGTNAAIYLELPIVYEKQLPLEAPGSLYLSMTALDTDGNESDYGSDGTSTWVRGQSLYVATGNMLTNSDFERDYDEDDEPDEWTTNMDMDPYGYGGGGTTALRHTSTDGSCYAEWPANESDSSIQVPFELGQTFIVSAKIKCTDTAWEWYHDDTLLPGKTQLGFEVHYYGGTTSFLGYSPFPMYAGVVDLEDGWQLIWATVEAPIVNDHFIGFKFHYTSGSGVSVTIDLDQCKLEYGVRGGVPTAWAPNLSRLDPSSGILFDTSGVLASGFSLDPLGNVVCSSLVVNSIDFEDHGAYHERAAADEIDGDHLDIDFTPTNYTPSTTPAEAADVDDLAAHLAGIDNALAASGGSTTGSSWNSSGNTTIQTTYTTVASHSVTVGAGQTILVHAHASVYCSGWTSNDYVQFRIYDGTSSLYQIQTLTGNGLYYTFSMTVKLTKTGTYTMSWQAIKASTSINAYVPQYYGILTTEIVNEV